MRTKKVNRFWCDYCNKAGCSASHMSRHEEGCTLNPNRTCGFCVKLLQQEQSDIATIIASLPPESEYLKVEKLGDQEWTSYDSEYLNGILLPIIREKTGDCPACIMAVLRQAYIPTPAVSDFDFKKERQDIWDDINDSHTQRDYY